MSFKMKFILTVENKPVFAVETNEHYTKDDYISVQNVINRYLDGAKVEHYKLKLEH